MKAFEVTEDMFLRANAYTHRRYLWMFYFLLVFPPLNLLEYGLTTKGFVGMAAMFVLALAIIVFAPRFLRRRGRNIYRENAFYQQSQRFAIRDGEVHFEAENGSSHFAPKDLKRIDWHGDMVLIWPSSVFYHIVPLELLDKENIESLEGIVS